LKIENGKLKIENGKLKMENGELKKEKRGKRWGRDEEEMRKR
jgi:hypothetical protein